MKKIDLGCGDNKRKGFIGIDKYKLKGVDIVLDIDKKKLPFKDSEVDEVYTRHLLQVVDNYNHVINEIYRVAKNNAKVTIISLHFSYAGNSPYHVRSFSAIHSFEKNMSAYNYTAKFEVMKSRIIFNKGWYLFWNYLAEPLVNLGHITQFFYEETFLSRLFPAAGVLFILKVKK